MRVPSAPEGHLKPLSSQAPALMDIAAAGGAALVPGSSRRSGSRGCRGPQRVPRCSAQLWRSDLPASPQGLCLAVSSAQALPSVLLPGAGARCRLTCERLAKRAGSASPAISRGFVLQTCPWLLVQYCALGSEHGQPPSPSQQTF